VNNPKIDKIVKALKPFSSIREANAAVSILLKPTEQDLNILFVKRVENPRDLWSGQIALPGGKRDPKDRDLKETVMRETLEETGINLESCRFLGVTEPIRSRVNPEMKVLPFVFLIENEPIIKLNRDELERYHWIPIKDLVKNERIVKFRLKEHSAFIIGDIEIWGLTFRILKSFLRVINRGSY